MRSWASRLEAIAPVCLFDYPYMLEGRSRPDPLPKLIASHQAALARVRAAHAAPAVLIGKSMGSRIGCHVALQDKVAALVCLGYPLCGGGDPVKLRDKVLLDLQTPVLFVQGTRDPLCPLNLLDEVRARMQAPSEVCLVEGGDHSLRVGKNALKSSDKTQDDIDREILERITNFLNAKFADQQF